MKNKISKLICVLSAVFIVISCMPLCYAVDYYDNTTSLDTAISDKYKSIKTSLAVDGDSVIYNHPSKLFMSWYGYDLTYIQNHTFTGSYQIGKLFFVTFKEDFTDTDKIKLYYDTDKSLYYYGTDDNTPIFYWCTKAIYYDSSKGYYVTDTGSSNSTLTARIYVGGYDITGIQSYIRPASINYSTNPVNYSSGILNSPSYSQTYVWTSGTTNYFYVIKKLEYAFVPSIDSSVPNSANINFEQYYDWSSVYDDVNISFTYPFEENNLLYCLLGEIIRDDDTPEFTKEEITEALGVDNPLEFIGYSINRLPLSVSDLVCRVSIKNNGSTPFDFYVTANKNTCGTYRSGNDISINSSSNNLLNVWGGSVDNNISSKFSVPGGTTKYLYLPFKYIYHDTSSLKNSFYVNFWSKEAYRVNTTGNSFGNISTTYSSSSGGTHGGLGSVRNITPKASTVPTGCYTHYYYLKGLPWTTNRQYDDNYTAYLDDINTDLTETDNSTPVYDYNNDDEIIKTITTTDNTLAYSKQLISITNLLLQIRDGIYELPTYSETSGLFISLQSSVEAIPDAVESSKTAVVAAVNAVPIAVNAGFANLSADLNNISADLGDLKLINNDMATDLDTMQGDLGDVKTATYNISNYYSADAETTPTETTTPVEVVPVETETYPLVDNTNTNISEVSGYKLASFTSLISSCGDYLDYVRQGMTRVFPPVVWTLLGAGLTAVVVGRVLGR